MKRLLTILTLFFSGLIITACDLDPGDVDPDLDQVEINVTANIAEATLDVEPDTVVEVGTEVTITASEVTGVEFVRWEDRATGDVLSSDRVYTFIATNDVTFEAIYEAQVSVELSSDMPTADLTVSPAEQVNEGDTITIEATAPAGYVFDRWLDADTGDLFSTQNPHTFTVSDDVALEAVFISEMKAAAEAALEAFDNDFSHMEGLLETFETSTAMEMELDFSVTLSVPDGTSETLSVNLVQRTVEDDGLWTETQLNLGVPDAPFDTIDLHLIIKETDDFYEAFVDVGFLLDFLEEKEDMDARELLAFESDFLHVTVPQAMREEFGAIVTKALETELDDDAIDEETMEMILNELQALQAYYDLAYFTSIEPLVIDAEIVNETDVLTTVIVNSDAMKTVFEDIFKDMYAILLMAEVEEEMPPYEMVIELPEYEQMLAVIDELDEFVVEMTHTPGDPDTMHVAFGLADFFAPFEDELNEETIEAINFAITLRDGVTITPVDKVKDVYDIAEDLFMIFLLTETLEYLRPIDEQDALLEGTYTFNDILYDHAHYFAIPVISNTESTVTISGDAIHIDPVYEHNGEPVFTEPMSLTDLEALGLTDDEPPVDRDAFLALIEPVDRNALNIYQILIELMRFAAEEMPEEIDEPDNGVDTEYPTEDLVDFPDLADIPRYAESIMIDGMDGDYQQFRHYLSEADSEIIYNHYLELFLDSPAWNIHDTGYVTGESTGFFELTSEDIHATIVIQLNKTYDTAEIVVYTAEQTDEETDETADKEIPEEDLAELDDLEVVPRYPGSVLIEGGDGDDVYLRRYVSEDDPEDLYNFYLDHYNNEPGWTILDHFLDVEDEEGYISVVDANMNAVIIGFYPSETYVNAWEIRVQHGES